MCGNFIVSLDTLKLAIHTDISGFQYSVYGAEVCQQNWLYYTFLHVVIESLPLYSYYNYCTWIYLKTPSTYKFVSIVSFKDKECPTLLNMLHDLCCIRSSNNWIMNVQEHNQPSSIITDAYPWQCPCDMKNSMVLLIFYHVLTFLDCWIVLIFNIIDMYDVRVLWLVGCCSSIDWSCLHFWVNTMESSTSHHRRCSVWWKSNWRLG